MQLQITNKFLCNVYLDFLERCEEIQRYIQFVDVLDGTGKNVLSKVNSINEVELSHDIDRELHKTLRASTYLLIYNLLESTMSDALDAVYATLVSKNVDYMMLNDKFKKVVLSNIKKGLSDKAITEVLTNNTDIRTVFLSHGYNKRDLFNGNLDVRVIKDFANKYDFSIRPVNSISGVYNPEIIKEIRIKRNALAHGAISFAQCGQNIPVFSLRQKFEEAQKLLLAVFNGLDSLLSQEKYLKPTT